VQKHSGTGNEQRWQEIGFHSCHTEMEIISPNYNYKCFSLSGQEKDELGVRVEDVISSLYSEKPGL
jgi:hypothetical protein